ncbi:uncharacterized protein N7515_008672 [Penicillium bovifimosum]|uniref:Uncharacterized protein n=1 Tax=Penicillium bovifimosum TaxID=126998 RepID=A0A9W9GPQ2_9EURO|nr:uncharacterized protein N7515_008672 [Penicillium bovifimosum]KAJ5124847.1 hypothetical protein N7515_008672 [Penicillium bovifimosum]
MQVPTVTLEDLQAFHAEHFPSQQRSTLPAEDTPADDLGYYPDGVKRTLTDEEIRIFRHSEIHALLRQRQREQEEREYESRMQSSPSDVPEGKPDDAPERLTLQTHSQAQGSAPKRSPSRKGPKGAKRQVTEETALEPLDYGDESRQVDTAERPERPPVSQMPYQGRRVVSYDD